MTEQFTRVVPTPGDLALRPERHSPPGHGAASFGRQQWEEELLAAELPHYAARLLGWGLAHLAGPSGYMPAGTTNTERLGRKVRLTGRQVRMSLTQLEQAGLISRPDIHTWEPQEKITRPITLTLPSARAGRRQDPPHPGGRQ